MDYASYFELDIEHPLIAPVNWQLLSGRNAEFALASQRLRLRFGAVSPTQTSTQPIVRLSFIGEKDWYGGEGLAPLSAKIKSMEFYLFCRDPYFNRVTNVPLIKPGRELLHFDFRHVSLPQAAGTSGASGPKCAAQADVMQLEAAAAPVILFDESLAREVSDCRKKYHGTPFGPPPLALISLPFVGRTSPARFRLNFVPREVCWTYEIIPQPACNLLIEGGPCAFQAESDSKQEKNMLRLASDSKMSLGISPRPRLRLLIECQDGSYTPLMEDLPLPAAGSLGWNKVLNDYEAIVRLDLERFGLSF